MGIILRPKWWDSDRALPQAILIKTRITREDLFRTKWIKQQTFRTSIDVIAWRIRLLIFCHISQTNRPFPRPMIKILLPFPFQMSTSQNSNFLSNSNFYEAYHIADNQPISIPPTSCRYDLLSKSYSDFSASNSCHRPTSDEIDQNCHFSNYKSSNCMKNQFPHTTAPISA